MSKRSRATRARAASLAASRGQGGQLALGLGRPSLEVRGLGGHEARAEAAALGEGGAGQLLGQGMVVAAPGGDRSRLE